MEKQSLFSLNEQLIAIDAILADNTDEETGEILEGTHDALIEQIDDKIESVLDYIGVAKSQIDYLKSEEKRISARRKVFENRVEYLKKMILCSLKLKGITKGDFGTYKVSVVKGQERVVLNDDALQFLPDDCFKIERTPLKTVIKDRMGDNDELVTVVDGQNIVIAHREIGEDSLRYK